MSVALSILSFDEDHPAVIATNETMSPRYILMADFTDPVTAVITQSCTQFQNNGYRLNVLPSPNTYSVALYWIQFNDSTGTVTTGPVTTVSVTITTTGLPPNCSSQANPSTPCVCGTFDTPLNPEDGRCVPYRTKISCEAPLPPQAECGEQNFQVVFTPSATPPFSIVSVLFDSLCEAILDQSGNPIQTIVA